MDDLVVKAMLVACRAKASGRVIVEDGVRSIRAADAQMAFLAEWATGYIAAITHSIEAELSWGC